MARHKNSAALFEVMNKNRAGSRPGVLSSLGGWFRPRGGSSMALPPAPAPAAEAPAPARIEPPAAGDEPAKQVVLRMSYTSATISVFALATVVGAAFLAGQRAQGVRPAISSVSDADLRGASPQGAVVNVKGAPVGIDPLLEQDMAEAHAKPVAAKGSKRTAGLNYVIIQSYPEEKMAVEARKLLDEKGIDATVERHLANWGTATNWYMVVGTLGFQSRLSNSEEYQAYIKRIKEISDSYGYGKKSFKAFDPRPYKWSPKDK